MLGTSVDAPEFPVDVPMIAALGQLCLRDLPRRVSDSLGVFEFGAFQQTLGYRLKGEDTLNYGDPVEWIEAKWTGQCLAETSYWRGESFESCPAQMRELWAVQAAVGLSRVYTIDDQAAVGSFLRAHPELMGVLAQAATHLRRLFGPEPQVALEVVVDPEAEQCAQLVAYVCTVLPVEEALARLRRLDEEWFLDQLDLVGGLFNFNLELA